MYKENAPDTEFVDMFHWASDLNVITKVFWADEAVGAYKVQEIAACPCSDSQSSLRSCKLLRPRIWLATQPLWRVGRMASNTRELSCLS